MKRILTIVLALSAASAAGGEPYVWLEGEAPTKANIEIPTSAWSGAEFLSDGNWAGLAAQPDEMEKEIPEDGALVSYDFEVAEAGTYEVWGRIGMESIRTPFDWRIDDGPRDTITKQEPEDVATDLQELGRWKSIGWVLMGEAELKPGRHTLHIRIPRAYGKDKKGARGPKRVVWTADAFCLYRGRWVPNGKHKPDADWRTEQDIAAEKHVFAMPAAESPRVALPLHGRWQMARFDERGLVEDREGPVPLPELDLHWGSMSVPGDRRVQRPDLVFNHRYLLKTRVDVPAGHKGRAFVLDFDEVSTFVTVHVNGRRMGHRTIPLAGWQLDVTEGIEPGKVNEIVVGVKDRYYALKQSRGDRPNTRYAFNRPEEYLDRNQGTTHQFDYPMKGHGANGILDRVKLISAGPVYVADVFAKPSVTDKKLALEITLHNPTGKAAKVRVGNRVEPHGGGDAEKAFAAVTKTVPAGESLTFEVSEPWKDPHLWWRDDPFLYDVVTTLSAGGKPIDEARTRFGFRQWEIRGTAFFLNGVRQQLRADLSYGGATKETRKDAVAFWRQSGQNMFRLRFHSGWGGMRQARALDFFDEHGVPVRKTVTTFDGQHASYALALKEERDGKRVKVANEALFDNVRAQARARTRDYRNNPSVFLWELDNEIVYINARNFGNLDVVEPEFKKMARAVGEVDPTRPGINVAGGRALMDQSLPVNGCHYETANMREYPDMAYGLEGWTGTSAKQPWPMAMDKPIFLSEDHFIAGKPPGWFAQVGGERCFLGRSYTREAAALSTRMLSEGYRWIDLAGFHFWHGDKSTGGGHYISWQPVAVLCRQWNTTFGSGAKVSRTLKVFNDTHHDTPIEASWSIELGGKKVAGESKTFRVPPGEAEVWQIAFRAPETTERLRGRFVLRAARDGKQVFDDARDISVLDADGAPKPSADGAKVVVWDEGGAVSARLRDRGLEFTAIKALDEVPGDVDVLIVGPDLVSPRQATSPRWRQFAASGAKVLVLDQQHPLHYQATPADFEVTDHVGRIAFSQDMTHPAFAGLAPEDLRFWSDGHVVYRHAYRKPSRGARSLVQCDGMLGETALAVCTVDKGALVLCQLAIGTKLGVDPVATRMFDNLVNYTLGYRLEQKATAVVFADGSPAARMIAESGLVHDRLSDPVKAVAAGKHEIVVVEATPANLRKLASRKDAVRRFHESGGWLMLWGVTPESLEHFNALVGVKHLLRPFRLEKVALTAPRDPLTTGLSQRDVVMYTGQKIFRHKGDQWLADDIFSHVVDYDDIAPFAAWPQPAYFNDPDVTGPGRDTWPLNMVNGLTGTDMWVYTFTIHAQRGDPTKFTIDLPRTEKVIGLRLRPNRVCDTLRSITLTFHADGDTTSEKLTVEPYTRETLATQEWEFDARAADRVTIDLSDIDVDRDLTGLDNLALRVKRSSKFYEKVKPMLNVGGLVRYPQGKGGILLNQLHIPAREKLPENAEKKKTIFTTVLGNLHATFEGARSILPGEGLRYHPVSMEKHCNLYLDGEQGWPLKPDLAHLPLNRQKFEGVVYQIRDFKTSPLESAVTLQGMPRVKAPKAVEGIEVGRKADALFFLHTMVEKREWKPGRRRREPPAVWEYVVHYADGQTAVVPVNYGLGAAHYVQARPTGLKDAVLAWAAASPGAEEAESGETPKTAVYAMQWTNPRPDVAIASVDMRQGPGRRYGAPVLLAVTAAERIE